MDDAGEQRVQEDEPQREARRSLAELAFGVGGGVAGTVYGTVVAMATLTAAYATEKHPGRLAVIVSSTAIVLWLAHLHAHALSESLEENRWLQRHDVARIARREVGIVLAASTPTAALLLGWVGVFRDTTAVWIALMSGLVVLLGEGIRYARLEHLRPAAALFVIGLNLALGLLIVALKVALAH
jgi:hypothetical protein